jgi:hypothetical protein
MREGHIDRDARFSSFSLDATERDDFLACGNELFGDEANVKSSIEASEKALEYILKAVEMATSDGHTFRQIVYDMRRLYPS